jgi:hypothetical protein
MAIVVVVCVVTGDYVRSRWCFGEIAIAETLGSRLLPLSVEPGVRHPLLGEIQHVTYDEDRQQAAERVCMVLREIDAAGGAGWPDGRSPFPGLRPFEVDTHAAFFGRHAEADALVRRLRSADERGQAQTLVVIGPSGCGKSSLVRAGLVPAMAREPGCATLHPLTPGADPVAALSRVLAAALTRNGDCTRGGAAAVRHRLSGTDGLGRVAEDLLGAHGRSCRRLLVVIDQFDRRRQRSGA